MGELAALAAALCWAAGFVALRGIAGSFPSLQLNAIRLWAPAVIMPVGMFAFGLQGEFLKLGWHNFAAMAGSVVLGIGLGETLLFGIMRLIGVTRSYTIASTAPMFGLVYAVVIAMMWGLDFTLLKTGIGDLPPVVANSFRMPAAAIAIGLLAWKSAGRLVPMTMTNHDRAIAVLSGAIGLGAGSIFFLSAIQTLGAGRAGAIGAVSPVLAMMLAVAFLKQRPGWLTASGTFLAVAGVAVLSLT